MTGWGAEGRRHLLVEEDRMCYFIGPIASGPSHASNATPAFSSFHQRGLICEGFEKMALTLPFLT